MSPQIGFDEEVAARAAGRVGTTERLADAMNHNLTAAQLEAHRNPRSAPFLALEHKKCLGWVNRRAQAIRELIL